MQAYQSEAPAAATTARAPLTPKAEVLQALESFESALTEFVRVIPNDYASDDKHADLHVQMLVCLEMMVCGTLEVRHTIAKHWPEAQPAPVRGRDFEEMPPNTRGV